MNNRTVITGYSLIDSQYKSNVATLFVTLKDFKERYSSSKRARNENAEAVLMNVAGERGKIKTGLVVPIAPPAIPGIGTTGGFEFWIQDNGGGRAGALVGAGATVPRQGGQAPGAHRPEHDVPRYVAAVPRRSGPREGEAPRGAGAGCVQRDPGPVRLDEGQPVQRVQPGLEGGPAVRAKYRQRPEDITRLYTGRSQGQMVPLSAIVTTELGTGPDLVPHFNGFPAAKVTGNAAPGYSSGRDRGDGGGGARNAADRL